MTRILLYSVQPILVAGLETVLHDDGGFEILPTSCSMAGLVERMASSQPDVVLMDLTNDVTFEVLNDLRIQMAQCKVVLWVKSIPTALAFQALGLGVRGILRKTLPTDLQVKCLQKVHQGELWFEKTLAVSVLCARRIALTRRDGQLITLLSQGLKNKEIATALGISEGTAKIYLSRLFAKVHVKDRLELAQYGLKNLTSFQ